VKVLIEGITEKVIMQEAEVWRKLSHPNIHNFLRACPSGPTPLLMSEYHKNGSACKYLEEHGNDEPGVDRLGLVSLSLYEEVPSMKLTVYIVM
jgi:hypothetical protein